MNLEMQNIGIFTISVAKRSGLILIKNMINFHDNRPENSSKQLEICVTHSSLSEFCSHSWA